MLNNRETIIRDLSQMADYVKRSHDHTIDFKNGVAQAEKEIRSIFDFPASDENWNDILLNINVFRCKKGLDGGDSQSFIEGYQHYCDYAYTLILMKKEDK